MAINSFDRFFLPTIDYCLNDVLVWKEYINSYSWFHYVSYISWNYNSDELRKPNKTLVSPPI